MESKLTNSSSMPTNVATETLILVSDPVNYLSAVSGEGLMVRGTMNITAGAGTTAIVVRVRKGNGLGGAVVGNAVTHTLAAAASANIPYEFLDQPPAVTPISTPTGAGAPPGNIYTLSVQQTGGTGAGTVNYATFGCAPAANGW